MALSIKKGDNVIVIAGKDKGKSGKVLSSNPAKSTVVVEGVNEITKHVKPRSAQQQGGIVKENGPINVTNVMLLCPVCNKGVRYTVKTEEGENGKKVRICKKCGAVLDFKVEEAKPAKKKTVRKKSAKKAEESAEVAENAEVAVATEEAPKKKTVRKKSAKTEEAVATEEVKTEAKKPVRKKSAKTADETSNA